jgi:hypothetical protein
VAGIGARRVAGAQPPGTSETQLAERFAALLGLWTQDELLAARTDQSMPSDRGARPPTWA